MYVSVCGGKGGRGGGGGGRRPCVYVCAHASLSVSNRKREEVGGRGSLYKRDREGDGEAVTWTIHEENQTEQEERDANWHGQQNWTVTDGAD